MVRSILTPEERRGRTFGPVPSSRQHLRLVLARICAHNRHQYGLRFTTLRYTNVYGPRQIPHGEAGVVAIFMDNLLNGKPSTLNHFAEDPEGVIRDYCYVGDIAEANLLALDKGNGDFFNIGTGIETKTLTLYRVIYEAVREIRPGLPEELAIPATALARPGDVTRSCLRVEKAQNGLGWSPKNDLREGIRQTLEWWAAVSG